MSKKLRILLLVLIAGIGINSVFQFVNAYKNYKKVEEISYSTFQEKLQKDEFKSATIIEKQNTQMIFNLTPKVDDKIMYKVIIPNRDQLFSSLAAEMKDRKVDVSFSAKEDPSFLGNLIMGLFPVLLIVGAMIWMAKSSKGGQGGIFSMFKHKAYLVESDVRFSDIAGNEETIQEVKEIVDFLKDNAKYEALGAKIPKGVLMVGPPGTGKTLLAKAVSGEAGVPFFTTSGSEFVEVFSGLGAGRIRDLFKEARAHAPCIIFIDEIDAIGKSRNSKMSNNEEREQTLNQLLVEMDGVGESGAPIIIMGATNRPETLDDALVRPGRFDRQVQIGLPDVSSREKILKIHAKKIKLSKSVLLSQIAKSTAGFSGADLANLCNEAAIFAAREGSKEVQKFHFNEAVDKILMGVRHLGIKMDDNEKSLTAYHEAGHAIIGFLKDEANIHDAVHKVSIIPRGRALGVTVYQPEKDRVSLNKEEIKAQICSLFGGRVAEQLIFGEEKITTGASNDIERATQYAYNYVTKWGLDETIGPIHCVKHESYIDGQERLISEKTIDRIEQAVKKLIDECYAEAKSILEDNKDKLVTMHDALIEYETIESDVVEAIMKGTFNIERVTKLREPEREIVPDGILDGLRKFTTEL